MASFDDEYMNPRTSTIPEERSSALMLLEAASDGFLSGEFSLDDGPGGGRRASTVPPAIAKAETRQVRSYKWLVIIVLVSSAIGVALGTFYYIRDSQSAAFEDAYYSSAHKVLESVGKSMEKTLKSFDSLSVAIVSHVRATGQTWPTVHIPDFALRASKIIAMSDAIFLALMPLVTNDTRLDWEAWCDVDENIEWLNSSVVLQSEFDLYFGPTDMANHPKWSTIWGDWGDIPYNVSRDWFLPQWQNYPVTNDPEYPAYNWDWVSMQANEAPMTALSQHTVVISEAYMLPDPNDPIDMEETEIWADWLSGFVQPGEPYDEPASDLYFPIFDQVDSLRAPSSKASKENIPYIPSQHKVVGTLTATLFWRGLIQNILPPDTNNGVVVVFENPCNPTFTYQIEGPHVDYLGRGDFHDTVYDNYRITSEFNDLRSFAVGNSLYSGPPVDREFCPFTLHVYPSQDLYQHYHVKEDRILFTVGALLIFIFTSGMFMLYDFSVQRRQRLVLGTAQRSGAIVNSLFPEAVRAQLEDELNLHCKDGKKDKKKEEGGFKTSQGNHNKNVQDFLEEGDDMEAQQETIQRNMNNIKKSPPIAHLYQNTTVLFADLVGFTQWSSKRSPNDIFHLLESIYGEFDVIARHRKVFKVETIGDCYVAVTGLPKPQPRHAIIMARFARECRDKLQEVTSELVAELGEDTANLAIRVGLHSGPTTAGVLRGDKGRFQLFGDTVNTAARMESNGKPNRIHVSEATAKILTASGRAGWLTKRDALIEAKGKGTMQTYWCEPKASGSVASSHISHQTYESHQTNETQESDLRAGRLQEAASLQDEANFVPQPTQAEEASSNLPPEAAPEHFQNEVYC